MKKISMIAKDKLKRLDGDTVISLNQISKNLVIYDGLKKVVQALIDEEKDYILSLDSADDSLNTKHANAKGRIAGLVALGHMIEGSGDEVERREK